MNGIFDEPLLDTEYNYIVQNYADSGRIDFEKYLTVLARRFRGQSRRASINSTNQSSLSRNSSLIDDPEHAYRMAFKEFDPEDTGFISVERLQLGMLNYLGDLKKNLIVQENINLDFLKFIFNTF